MITYKHFVADNEVEGDALFLALQKVTGKIYRDVKINYRPDGKIVYHLAIEEKEDINKLIGLIKSKLNKKAVE